MEIKSSSFVYKWTYLPTMNWYIGSRTAKGCHQDDGYLCSSRVVKPMLLENISDWEREIIATGSPQEMRELEAEILDLVDAKNDPGSFNQHNGDGKFSASGNPFGNCGAPKGTLPWNKGLTKELDARVSINVKKASASRIGKKRNIVVWNKNIIKTVDNNLPWKGVYIDPNGEMFLTTVEASKKHDVHRMTIFRWAKLGKNGWKFIPKTLVDSELYESILKREKA